MSASKLSDRLEESAKDLIKNLLESDLVQKVLIPGQVTERTKAICHLAQKEGEHLVPAFVQMFKKGIELSDSTEEKEFFKKSVDVWNSDFKTNFYKNFEPQLGPIPDLILAKPPSKLSAEYCEHITRLPENGSILKFLAALLSGYIILCSMHDYVKSQPNFKPNVIFDALTNNLLAIHAGKAFVKALIDKRGPLEEKEEKEVFDTFRASLEFEYTFHTNLACTDSMLVE